MRKIKKILMAGVCVLVINVPFVAAKTTDEIHEKIVYFSKAGYTDWVKKSVTGRNAVIDLEKDSGSAWITATMVNKKGKKMKTVMVQSGTRKAIPNKGKAGEKYRLRLHKTYNTGGGKVKINGSWSPDAY